nr:amidinotransferase [Xanthomonadaceae bacterium]
MLTRDIDAFLAFARDCAPDFGPATAKAAFLVAPDGFVLAAESARDNRYMADAAAFDATRASMQHRELQRALSACLPTICFAGDPATPDAVFPNNVFATARGDARTGADARARLIVGRMRHPVRQREAERRDIRGFFRDTLGFEELDLSAQPHPCELTGALVVDRARGLGFCGLSER